MFPILDEITGVSIPAAGPVMLQGQRFFVRDKVLRAEQYVSDAQAQTSEVFGFKWHQRGTFESDNARKVMREWLQSRYGMAENMDWIRDGSIIVDIGCGAAFSAIELFGGRLRKMRFIGTDISSAIDVALARFEEAGFPGEFVQCDLHALPFRDGSCDVVFSEGVLHHTDSPKRAFDHAVRLVKPGGCIMFYVYRKKGPVREFTDDLIRAQLRALPPDEAWRAIEPLTKLGIALGQLNVSIDIEEDVPLLGIKAGKQDIQRFFYWNVAKTFYRPDLSFEEMAHINFDWFAPANAHRQTEAEVRGWCRDAGLQIQREVFEEAGITMIARRPG